MPIMDISIVPIGTQSTSLSVYVARAQQVLEKKQGIQHKLTAMGTIVEANSIQVLFDIARDMHNAVMSENVKRVLTTIKIDDRIDKKITMDSKIQSVQNKLKGK